ncbi:MAG: leucine-rich repeat protein [Bacteroidaceae bacterium]|nr:leucine-rich repeat protein [Bacteroidaceae bacterium]
MMFQIMSEQNKWLRIYGYTNDDGPHNSLSLTDTDYEGEIIVPEKMGQYTIRAVGPYAFYHCFAKVTLPGSVADIESDAFYYYYYSGYDFKLPEGVSYIFEYAFWGANIRGISLPSTLTTIYDYAFMLSNIEELIIPKRTSYIGEHITNTCKALKRLEVESGNSYYSSPSGSYVIMEKKTKTVIAGCKNSKIPSEAQIIGKSAFAQTEFENPIVIIPENITVIEEGAFEYSTMKRLVFTGETLDIRQQAFCCCGNLEYIDFYGGNVTVGRSAFEDCPSLKEMHCYSHKPSIQPLARQFYNVGNGQTKIFAKYPDEYTDEFDDYWGRSTGRNAWLSWFEPQIYPLDDGGKIVNEVRLTDFDMPVATRSADYTVTSLTEHALVEVRYAKWDGESWKSVTPTTFSLNSKYNIIFTVTLDDGYTFGNNPKAYVDDQEIQSSSVSATSTQRRFVVSDYVVPAPPGGVPITMVYARVAEPVEGQPLSTTVTSPVGRDAKYYDWVIDSVYWKHDEDASLDSFNPNKMYVLNVRFRAKENYCFSTTNLEAKLNDQAAAVTYGYTASGTPAVTLAISYGKTVPIEQKYITSAQIEIPQPEHGQPLSNEILTPNDVLLDVLNYTIMSAEWISGTWIKTGKPYDCTQEYSFMVGLKAKTGYTFVTTDQYTINGRTAICEGGTASDGSPELWLTVYYGGEAPPPTIDTTYISSVNIQINEPVEGEVPSSKILYPAESDLETSLYKIGWLNYWNPGGPFDKEKDFTHNVLIEANKPYCAFSPNVTAWVNGRKAEVMFNGELDGVPTISVVTHFGTRKVEGKILPGQFSVAEGKQVIFSQGNLQYKASTNTWRFAENQYDAQGDKNSNIAEDYTDFIDVFGWGTSGYNGKNPWMTSTTSTDYGDGTNDIAGTDYDWGVYNSESITNNAGLKWRTLTADEWYYLFYTRPNRGTGRATACNMHGYIILPDDWTLPEGLEFTKNAQTWDVNVYDADDWAKMEQAGAVFLPAAGYRYGATEYKGLGEWGYYWTSSAKNDNEAVSFYFAEYSFDADWSMGRENGYSVRLVSDVLRKKGDVNGDGKVNTADVVAVYTYIEKGDASGFTREAADVNNDGSVNTADVVAIYSIIIKGE